MDPSAPLGHRGAPPLPPENAGGAHADGGAPGGPGRPPQPPMSGSPGGSSPRRPPPGYGPGPSGPPPGYADPRGRPPPAQGPAAGYPPPAQRGRSRPRRDPGGLVAGLVIAGIGLFFLAGQLEPDIGRFVTLFIGLALLAVFVINRQYGFLVPGSILTGVGIGIAIDAATSGDAESGVMMLSIAGGFLGIWVLGSIYRLPQNHWWPLIPGGILTLIGLVQLGRGEVDAALGLWPVLLIVAGAFLLARAVTRRG